jgi:hypothetical protein
MKAKLSEESYRRGTENTSHKYSRRAIYHEIFEPTILFLSTVEKFLNNLHTQDVLSESVSLSDSSMHHGTPTHYIVYHL